MAQLEDWAKQCLCILLSFITQFLDSMWAYGINNIITSFSEFNFCDDSEFTTYLRNLQWSVSLEGESPRHRIWRPMIQTRSCWGGPPAKGTRQLLWSRCSGRSTPNQSPSPSRSGSNGHSSCVRYAWHFLTVLLSHQHHLESRNRGNSRHRKAVCTLTWRKPIECNHASTQLFIRKLIRPQSYY